MAQNEEKDFSRQGMNDKKNRINETNAKHQNQNQNPNAQNRQGQGQANANSREEMLRNRDANDSQVRNRENERTNDR